MSFGLPPKIITALSTIGGILGLIIDAINLLLGAVAPDHQATETIGANILLVGGLSFLLGFSGVAAGSAGIWYGVGALVRKKFQES